MWQHGSYMIVEQVALQKARNGVIRFAVRVALCFLVCSLVTAQAGAVGKITVDPNVPGARVETSATEETDRRLDQNVTYEAKRKTVLAILADLSEMTGITFRAGCNNRDWQVRDRKMSIFIKDMPLANLMSSIAHVMKFKWEIGSKDNMPTYRLYMDRKTLLGAERERFCEEELLKKKLSKQREDCLAGLEVFNGLSNQDLDTLKSTYPALYMQAKFGWADLLPELFAQVPAARDAWLTGEELPIAVSALTPELQEALHRTTNTMVDTYNKITGGSIVAPPDISNGTFMINFDKGSRGYQIGSKILGIVTVRAGSAQVESDFVGPESESMRRYANKVIAVLESSEAPIGIEGFNQMNKNAAQEIGEEKTDLGEPINVHPEDTSLHNKVQIKIEGDTFADMLAALAKASGFAVVSDSFEKRFPGIAFSGQEVELKSVLDKIESCGHYNWDKQGTVLEFRDRDWFRKRAAQIPEAWLEPWRKALINTDTLDIDYLSQISMLSDEQFWANILSDDVLGGIGLANLICLNRNLLKFYACMNENQRSMLLSDNGIDLPTLAPDREPLIDRLLGVNSKYLDNSEMRVNISGVKKTKGKQFEYEFAVTAGGEPTPIAWNFTTPKYELSKSEQPKKRNLEDDTGKTKQ